MDLASQSKMHTTGDVLDDFFDQSPVGAKILVLLENENKSTRHTPCILMLGSRRSLKYIPKSSKNLRKILALIYGFAHVMEKSANDLRWRVDRKRPLDDRPGYEPIEE